MTPAARVQAAIDILDEIIAAARANAAAADTLLARYFASRRYAGSKDRRAVRDLVFAAIRRTGEIPESGRAALVGLVAEQPGLAESFDGSAYGPAPIAAGEPGAAPGVAPKWLIDRIAPDDLPGLLARAPLDIRANRLRTTREALLPLWPEARPGALAPDSIRLPEGTPVERTEEWAAGLFEVQDEGSQLIVAACDPAPGMAAIDLCAGAGGKTLAMVAAMANEGTLIACDIDRARLSRLGPRAARAGVTIVTERLLDPGREAQALTDWEGRADVVLVDAPCSGSGTWRRNPEARWRLTPARLERLRAMQAQVMAVGAALVRPGGALVYAVCSLLPEEGPDQAAAFLAARPGWSADPLPFGRAAGPGRQLTPASDGTDGFFVARLRPPC